MRLCAAHPHPTPTQQLLTLTSLATLSLVHSTPDTLASILLCNYTERDPASGPLHDYSFTWNVLSLQRTTEFLPSFLLDEVFPGHFYRMTTPHLPCSGTHYLLILLYFSSKYIPPDTVYTCLWPISSN